MSEEPILILGAGPAGTLAALGLARAGRSCRVLERETDPFGKVCGEFLSPEAVARLDGLGFPWQQAEATVVSTLRLECAGRAVSAPLPFAGRGVRRDFLDAWLERAARQAGAVVDLGVQVRHVARRPDGFRVETSGGQLDARCLILATGKHGLPELHPRRAAPGPALVGWKMNFRHLGQGVRRSLSETIDLFFFDGGYGGISRIADDVVTVSVLVEAKRLRGHPGSPADLLRGWSADSPLLAELLAEAELAWPRPRTVGNLPYGHCDPSAERNLLPVGDQFAVLPSFTGTGMAFAMASGAAAARHLLSSPPEQAPFLYATEARRMAARVLGRAMFLHRLLQRPGFARTTLAATARLPWLVPLVARGTRVREAFSAQGSA